MLMVNPWRMALIFFLSGFALCLIEPKISSMALLKIRFTRIFVPLLIGMYTVLIPQPYFEAVQHYGYSGGFWAFTIEYFNPNTELLPQMHHGPLGLVTWNHLWYLVYLWHYTLVYLILKPLLLRVARFINESSVMPCCWLAMLISLITLMEVTLEPMFPATHALIDDWYNHARYFTVFLAGYFVAKSPRIFDRIVAFRWGWVSAAIPLYFLSLVLHQTGYFELTTLFDQIVATACLVTNALCWMFGLIALSGRFLTKSNKALTYLNEAVLPWYILHQSVIIMLGVLFSSMELGGVFEPILLVTMTFCVCAGLYECIRRSNVLRVVFGMKLV
ncbi:acyltransferase family protein [Arenicella sp. 4NH20-0111]